MANKETFCIACMQGLRKLYRCNNPLSIKLLVFILEFADFDTGYSSVSHGGLIDASRQFNVSENEILESLDELIENEIIFRAIGRELTTGKPALFDYIFILNPHAIWFGKYANKEPLVQYVDKYLSHGMWKQLSFIDKSTLSEWIVEEKVRIEKATYTYTERLEDKK